MPDTVPPDVLATRASQWPRRRRHAPTRDRCGSDGTAGSPATRRRDVLRSSRTPPPRGALGCRRRTISANFPSTASCRRAKSESLLSPMVRVVSPAVRVRRIRRRHGRRTQCGLAIAMRVRFAPTARSGSLSTPVGDMTPTGPCPTSPTQRVVSKRQGASMAATTADRGVPASDRGRPSGPMSNFSIHVCRRSASESTTSVISARSVAARPLTRPSEHGERDTVGRRADA